MKLGGMSTPWGITFFSENYESSIINGKLKISKNKYPGGHILYLMLGIYLLFDVAIYFRDDIYNFILYYIPKTSTPLINYTFPAWAETIFLILGFIIQAAIYYVIFWFLYKARGYHGAEHKVITAASKNNLKNAAKAKTITSRCGSNLLAPYAAIFGIFNYFGLILPGTSMLLAVIIYTHIPKARRVISYIGARVQKLTTREPTKQELMDAERGINAIIDAEDRRIYRRIKPFFVSLPMRD